MRRLTIAIATAQAHQFLPLPRPLPLPDAAGFADELPLLPPRPLPLPLPAAFLACRRFHHEYYVLQEGVIDFTMSQQPVVHYIAHYMVYDSFPCIPHVRWQNTVRLPWSSHQMTIWLETGTNDLSRVHRREDVGSHNMMLKKLLLVPTCCA